MSARDAAGLALAPLFLRVMLGVTFLWSGLGKVFDKIPVEGPSAVYLATLGVDLSDEPTPDVVPVPDPTKTAGTPAPLTPAPPQPPSSREGNNPIAERHLIPRVYGVALLINKASYKGRTVEGDETFALWPSWLSSGKWPVILARAVTAAEIFGGLFVLTGLLTRASALSLCAVMLGAIWLTEIGPAMQSGNVEMGFLPKRPLYAIETWRPLLWQFSLMMSALALAFMGSGTLGFDRALFPKSAPKPKPVTFRPTG